MQLFLDIDGVLLNFEHSFVHWLNVHLGLSLPEDYQAQTWDFEEVLPKDVLEKAWLEYLESEFPARMQPLISPEMLNDLLREHTVHLLTNFPEPHMKKRLDNLAELGIGYQSLHYCGLHAYKAHTPRTKSDIIADLHNREQGALFVDDHPDNCLDVHANCPEVEVWVMSRRFNRDFDHPEIKRAKDWQCLIDRLG